VDRHHFEREVRRLEAERHAKGFSCWSQFVAMMFCQLAQAKSLREIVDGLACCEGKLRHLGLENGPRRSTLCYANAHRPWQLYEGVFHSLLNLAQRLAPAKHFRFKNRQVKEGTHLKGPLPKTVALLGGFTISEC
jgi:hypothetical protein